MRALVLVDFCRIITSLTIDNRVAKIIRKFSPHLANVRRNLHNDRARAEVGTRSPGQGIWVKSDHGSFRPTPDAGCRTLKVHICVLERPTNI